MFVWGSILSWFIVLPITSSSPLYTQTALPSFFNFVGVFYEVFLSSTFWFYWPLATVIALLPTIVFRMLSHDLDPHLVDDVRLKMKKEGRRLFHRAMIRRKFPHITIAARASTEASLASVSPRTGYAFSHKEGFAELILSGISFGLSRDKVVRERSRRMSTIISSASCTPQLERKVTGVGQDSKQLEVHHYHTAQGPASAPEHLSVWSTETAEGSSM